MAEGYAGHWIGQGITDDGVSYFSWPIAKFVQWYTGFADPGHDDWKAVVYMRGGPKPSLVTKTDIDMCPSRAGGMEVRLLWWTSARSEYDKSQPGGIKWTESIGQAETTAEH